MHGRVPTHAPKCNVFMCILFCFVLFFFIVFFCVLGSCTAWTESCRTVSEGSKDVLLVQYMPVWGYVDDLSTKGIENPFKILPSRRDFQHNKRLWVIWLTLEIGNNLQQPTTEWKSGSGIQIESQGRTFRICHDLWPSQAPSARFDITWLSTR